MATSIPHNLRAATDQDRGFWGSNWANSYKYSHWAGIIPNHLYHDVMRVLQDGLLKRGMQVTLAHLPGKPDALMGFVAFELDGPERPPVVHMVYVKDIWRQQGLAGALLDATVGRKFLYTHRTKDSDRFQRKRGWQVGYNPEPARRKEL